jgi:hypothetical protein
VLPKPGAVTLDFYDLAVVHQPIEGGGRNNGYINLGIRGQLFRFKIEIIGFALRRRATGTGSCDS